MVLIILWQITVVIQGFFAYGTVYRLTKNGGDNGIALFGWLLVLGLASLIPGLGIYLWYHYRDVDHSTRPYRKHYIESDQRNTYRW